MVAAGLAAELRPRARTRGWVRRSLACLGGLVAFALAAALVLLHSLDRPWLKVRVQRFVRTEAGVEVDYRRAHVALFSGVVIEGLEVRSPIDLRAVAPEFARVGRLAVHWTLASLLGRGPAFQRVEASNVTLTIVVDEHGTTSSDLLFPPAPGPGPALSLRASTLLGAAPPVGSVDVEHLTLILVRTADGKPSDRTELGGLSVALTTRRAEELTGGWRASLGLGSPTAPLDLELRRTVGSAESGAARARFWAKIDATPAEATAELDLHMLEQTFAATFAADHWLHLDASARFDPVAGRTQVTLARLDAGDGAVTAAGSLEYPDAGPMVVRSARGDIDLARLLTWLPAGVVPITAMRARMRYDVSSLVAGPAARISDGGAVVADVELGNVDVSAPSGSLHIDEGSLSWRARPADGGGLAWNGSMRLGAMRLASGPNHVAVEALGVDLDGRQAPDGAVDGVLGLRLAHMDERSSASSLVARDGHLELRVQGLHPDSAAPLATKGDVSLSAEAASIDLRVAGARAIADGASLAAHAALEGHAPYAFELAAPVSRLRLIGRDGASLADAPARVQAAVRDAEPDFARPAASRGAVHIALDLGDLHASAHATKAIDAVDYALHATAASLRALRPLLPPAVADRAPWDAMAATLRSSGRVERLGAGQPALAQTTEITVERPAFGNVAARSLAMTMRSHGTALQHQADLDLYLPGLSFDGKTTGDDHVAVSATMNRERPSVQFRVATEGRAAVHASGSATFDPSRRAVSYELDAHAAGLAALAPFAAGVAGLSPFDLSELEVSLSAHGALLGVVAGVTGDGAVRLEPTPARTAALEGTTDLHVAHFRWLKGETMVATPALAWHGETLGAGPRRTLESRLDTGTVHLGFGSRSVDLHGIHDDTRAALIGNLANPEVELTQHLSIRAVEQIDLAGYPVGDVSLALSAERGPEGVVHISNLSLTNGAAGTALQVSGNADLGDERRTLSITAALTQELTRLSSLPERFKGRGKLAVEATVTSPDFLHYGVRATVKGDDVTASLPRLGVEVESANGDVPVAVALEVGEGGVALKRSEGRSPYSMLRFADQHPLLTHSGFLSIARIKTPLFTIAPLVGNLEVEQNVVSLRQFEMGVRGGSITGQCGIDWDGPRSTVELHVRASGVQSSHGEPFDGNIAVAVSVADRTIDGRAEILRIGERHLLDLLDLQDPLHGDPAMNRIRAALAFGYPDSLRLIFDHGFASAHLELGGLARLVSIAELRGIPMGPIVDKMLAPVLDGPSAENEP